MLVRATRRQHYSLDIFVAATCVIHTVRQEGSLRDSLPQVEPSSGGGEGPYCWFNFSRYISGVTTPELSLLKIR